MSRTVYLSGLFLALTFRIAYSGYVSQLFLLLMLLLPWFSLLLSIPGMITMRYHLEWPDRLDCGEAVCLRLAVRHRQLFGTGDVRVRVKAHSAFGGSRERLTLRSNQLTYLDLNTAHCNTLQIKFGLVFVCDLLNLIAIPVGRSRRLAFPVCPAAEPPTEEFFPETDGGIQRPRPFSGSSSGYELRSYREGDSMRAIHWKRSAALDELVVRDSLEPDKTRIEINLLWPPFGPARDDVAGQLRWYVETLPSACLILHWQTPEGVEQEEILDTAADWTEKAARLFAQPGSSLAANFRKSDALLLQPRFREEAGA